ncbi:outer membrane lipoprotein-sorting protein [Paludibacterium purpuratum]|nr:outer membrane lipoprotein-sorting protein [Paludibacterium purpuratum]
MAFRNLYRDQRRTLATVVAVGAGLLAVLLFFGYIRFVEGSLASVVIYRDANAHVQVYRKDGPEQLAATPAQYSLDRQEQRTVHELAQSLPHFRRVSDQLVGVGMVNAGGHNAVFLARGIDPAFEAELQADSRLAAPPAPLSRDGLLLTRQLQDLLGAPAKGSDVQLFGASYVNRLNAIEAPLTGSFSTGIEAIEDKGLKAPLTLLQSLYDTDAVSRVVVQLDDRGNAAAYRDALAARLERQAPGRYEVTTWNHPQIGQLYVSFMGFFNMVFAFTGTVVFVISLTTIQHTVAMNVADRTREIGMLRAMGFSRRKIAGLFVRESVLTTLIAACVALGLAYLVMYGILLTHMQTQLPRIAEPVQLALDLPLSWALATIVVATLGIALGATVTARKRIGGKVLADGKSVPLTRLLTTTACLVLTTLLTIGHAHAEDAPSETVMRDWLRKADLARGGWGSYKWALSIHTEDPAGATTTTYDIAVRDGKALARTVEPKRYQGEKILIASRAMWYIKPGLRKPVSISPQQRLVGEAANGDIAATQYARDYTPLFVGSTQVNGVDCYKLKLNAATPGATYEGIVYYLDKRSLMGVKADFLTASGMVFKIATFEYGNKVKVNGREQPFVSSMKIVNANFPDRYSQLQYVQVAPSNPPDSLFALDTLMTM